MTNLIGKKYKFFFACGINIQFTHLNRKDVDEGGRGGVGQEMEGPGERGRGLPATKVVYQYTKIIKYKCKLRF